MPSKKEALAIAKYMNCTGIHMSKDNEWMPCSSNAVMMRVSNRAEKTKVKSDSMMLKRSKKSKRKIRGSKFEKLRERGVMGIDTLPGGGLVSAPIGGDGL